MGNNVGVPLKGAWRISLRAKCLIKQKRESKCSTDGQSGSTLGPQKKKKTRDKIHWRKEMIKIKEVSKRQPFQMTK